MTETVTIPRAEFDALLTKVVAHKVIGGENPVRAARKTMGMTQVNFAKAAGVGQGYLSQIENGDRQSMRAFKKISAFTHLSLDILVPSA